MKGNDMKSIDNTLWKDPSEKNWSDFAGRLGRSGIKFYKVFYEKGKLANREDLRDSYVQLFDSKGKPVIRVPVYMQEKGRVRGATIYLKGLLNINK